ncbi:hypothetical protein TRFO_09715 [Tritrichomonas foetus]|uniref:Uncharacterized protein n=1 Tax=Tritrichomonas foetus TaxID=1144522 RepID=A0A1J4JH67_9EUKA|nr:hypothetical protein TRFO_09715 [Tritrichomonas foetus]|eukprot:OHS96829.1 hypothetical protein TRFO_09715 [Tritrichomonas foetus]
MNAPDDYEPITEAELEEVEHFDPNTEDLTDDEEEEEEEMSEEEEEVKEKLIHIHPPPAKLHPVTQAKKPKVGKLPSPRQRKPVKKIIKPNVHVSVQNVPLKKK